MKIILIVILIWLLISSIKDIPVNFSNKLYENHEKRFIDTVKEDNEEDRKSKLIFYTVVWWIIDIIFIIVYAKIGVRFADNTYVLILSIIEVMILMMSLFNIYSYYGEIFDGKIPKHKKLKDFLCNVVNIVYYPAVIYLLIQSI